MSSDGENRPEADNAAEAAAEAQSPRVDAPEPTASEAAARAAKIRIGSQRWGRQYQEAKPRPAVDRLPPRPAAQPTSDVVPPPAGAAPLPGGDDPSPQLAGYVAAPLPSGDVAAPLPAGNVSAPLPAGDVSAPPQGGEDLSPQLAGYVSPPLTAGYVAPSHESGAERRPETTVAAAGAPSAPSSAGPADQRAQRPDKSRRDKPARPPNVEPYRATRTVAPPNTRAELTPDLEAELAEALGGVSIEAMIESTAPVAQLAELEPESRHRARVVAVQRDNVFVELGGRREGVLASRLFAELPEPGTVVEVVVVRFDAAEGLYELILPGGAVRVEDWSQVAEGMVVEAHVTGHNKGGLECDVSRLRGFIPASQASLYRVDDLAQFVGQKFPCVVTEANPDKRNLVLSRRAVLEREKADARDSLLSQLEVGQTREAVVRNLMDFGAFVDLGGIDGLIHISQLSWDRIKHPSEVLEVGQKVKVRIQKIDPATGKISLAFRDLSESPWASAAHKFPVRSKVEGTISRVTEFGAFVRLEAGIEGLIHISELSHKRVWRASDIVQEGQAVEVLILSVDPEQQRIGLSLKALEARAVPVKKEDEPAEEEAPAAPTRTRSVPLKGGTGRPSGGEKFGLNW